MPPKAQDLRLQANGSGGVSTGTSFPYRQDILRPPHLRTIPGSNNEHRYQHRKRQTQAAYDAQAFTKGKPDAETLGAIKGGRRPKPPYVAPDRAPRKGWNRGRGTTVYRRKPRFTNRPVDSSSRAIGLSQPKLEGEHC